MEIITVSETDEMGKLMFKEDKKDLFKMFKEKNMKMLSENLSFSYRINNELVGFIVLTKKDKNEILIHSLFVDEKHRRKGIATNLFKHSMENARKIYKDAYFSLHVATTNENAINLYKKLGFKITKTLPDFYLWTIPKGQEKEKDKNYDGYEMEYHYES